MTPEQKELVRMSFARLVPIADDVAAMFYGRLFALEPKLRLLFKTDSLEQGRKLMAMIGTAVAQLDRWERLAPSIRELGRRHADYGVTTADYDVVGAALIWTLETGLGAEFTPPLREAWLACYTLLAAEMKAAAQVPHCEGRTRRSSAISR